MSRRAIRRSYAELTGDEAADVREIAERAAEGEPTACHVLRSAVRTLGAVVGPLVRAFGAERVVLGGSMTGSWALFAPWFAETYAGPPVELAQDAETAGLIGAAYHAVTVSRPR
jgi:glucokinase